MAAKPKRKWPVIVGVVFVVAVIGALIYTSGGNNTFRCEVCVTFDGRTVCRNGAAPTKMGAERIAADTACTDLSSGMTSLMQCQNNAPRKVTWK